MRLMHSRWPIFGALVLGIGAVAVMWYAVLADPEGEAVPASGGHYVEGVTRAPERIHPLYAYANPTDRDIAALVYSGLVRLDVDGTPLPDLAERWEITGSGTRYVFHLRGGVAWHDGPESRFDADDVVATFAAITNPEFRGDPALAELMRGVIVTARDTRTVEFELEEPFAPFLAHLTVGILPSHLIAGLDADQLFNAEINTLPIGTGPYRVAGRTRSGVVLEPNSTYHFGPPYISTIEFRTLEEDESPVEALREGTIDGALFEPDAADADLDLLEDDERFVLRGLSGTSSYVVYFDTRLPIFEEVAVRGALVQAINQQSIIDTLAGGRGVVTETGIAPQSWAYVDVEERGFNPGDAARALELAGWARGRDGVRRKGDLRLSFTLSTPNEPDSVGLAEDIARQWRAVGVEANVLPIDAATYVEEHLLQRRFQTAIVEIDPGPDPDPYPFWHSSEAAPPGSNLSGYTDARLDEVLQRGRVTADPARRLELYDEFARHLIAGAPAVPLYTPVWTYAQRSDVRGFAAALLSSPSLRFANVHQWYMRTRIRE
jgi:peptide/nickel transport system substrate-binding protein